MVVDIVIDLEIETKLRIEDCLDAVSNPHEVVFTRIKYVTAMNMTLLDLSKRIHSFRM